MTRSGWNLFAISAVVISLFLYGAEREAHGRSRAETAHWKMQLDSLDAVKRGVDTIYRADTVRLWRTLARYDTARVTDTLVRNDTVFVPRAVADQAVVACRLTVTTCEERVTLRDQQLTVWQRRWDAREKPPSQFRRWADRVAAGLVGYGIGRLAP